MNRGGGGGAPQAKKSRTHEEDMDEMDELIEMEEDMMNDGGGQDIPVEVEETIESQEERFARWRRPEPPQIDEARNKLIFQQIDIDHYISRQPYPNMPGAKSGPVPVMRMFGVTKDGNSVCCHIHGFHPYFYVPAPDNFSKEHLRAFRIALNNAVIADMRNNKDNLVDAVLDVQILKKSTIYGFQGNAQKPYIKIMMSVPRLIAPAKRLLEKGEVNVPNFSNATYRAFESNIDFEIRFMADTNVVGCNWIELPINKYKIRKQSQSNLGSRGIDFNVKSSRCQIEVDIAWEEFISHAPEGEWADVAPFRILSYDIECAGRKGIFPEPDKDPVIQIANMVIRQGDKEPFIRNVFTLDTCAPIVGSDVISHAKETDLLDKWAEFIREVDPDIITGYNINNFDGPYLLNR